MIYETILVTADKEGTPHIAPFGVQVAGEGVVIAPFRPSRTLDNMNENPYAVVNFTDDVRVFAGALTGRRDWPTRPATKIHGLVLAQALSHAEVKVVRVEEDPLRPRLYCEILHEETHAPFKGFNRAQGAVVEAAILMSRLDLLAMEKIESEIAYLSIAVDKTAGEAEKEAWGWLMEHLARYRTEKSGEKT